VRFKTVIEYSLCLVECYSVLMQWKTVPGVWYNVWDGLSLNAAQCARANLHSYQSAAITEQAS